MRKVAVKVLKEGVSNEARDDFEREVEIMSAFDHDNILKLLGTVSAGLYLRMNTDLTLCSKQEYLRCKNKETIIANE